MSRPCNRWTITVICPAVHAIDVQFLRPLFFIRRRIGKECIQNAFDAPSALDGPPIRRIEQQFGVFLALWTSTIRWFIEKTLISRTDIWLNLLTKKTPECGLQYILEHRKRFCALRYFLRGHTSILVLKGL